MIASDENERICPVCAQEIAFVETWAELATHEVRCSACGHFHVGNIALDVDLGEAFWSNTNRAALAHLIRTGQTPDRVPGTNVPLIGTVFLSQVKAAGLRLPNRLHQLDRLISFLGNAETLNGYGLPETPIGLWAYVGSASSRSLKLLVDDAITTGLISPEAQAEETMGADPYHTSLRLSLAGWERWGELRLGQSHSSDGFIAMQFGNERLDRLVSEVVRPAIEKHLSVKLNRVDSPGTARAGLIDNVMRDAIESAAFVLVELSHANLGAYWEAGLAEGLGKPVIYLCEQAVWDDTTKRPHFDVNHRTTIMWEEDEPDAFIETLIATIRTTLRHHYPNNQE